MKELTNDEKTKVLKYVNVGWSALNQNIPEEYWGANIDFKALRSAIKKLEVPKEEEVKA